MQIVYRSLTESALTFNCVISFGNLNMKDKARVTHTVKLASKITGLR